MLHKRFSSIFVVWLCSLTIAWAETSSPSTFGGFTQHLDPRTWPFIPIPEVDTDPNGGTTVGLLPVFLFVDDQKQIYRIINGDITKNTTLGVGASFQILSYPSDDTQWSTTFGFTEHIQRSVDLRYSTGLRRDRWWSFDAQFLFDRDPSMRFFGFGNHSHTNSESNYTLEQTLAKARFGVNFSPALQLALDLSPRLVHVQRGGFTSLPFTGTQFPRLKGLHGDQNEFPVRLFLSYDTRNSLNVPTQGTLLSLWGGITDRSFLSSVSYSLVGFELRHYIPLTQRVTFAGHVSTRYMPVGRQAPFWALSQLGGDRSVVGERQPLRGYGAGRFVDRNMFAANMELRTRVWDLDLFETHVILELAPFLDVGRVFHDIDTNPLSALHPVGGLGFRGIAEPFVVGYVDIGYGSEGVAFFSGVNYPF